MKKLIISQSIMWASAILLIAILDDKNFQILLLVILATMSVLNLKVIKNCLNYKIKTKKQSAALQSRVLQGYFF